MAPQVGTYDIGALLDTRFDAVSLADYGQDTFAATLARDLAAHNAVVTEMIADLAEPTTDRLRAYGTGAVGEMVEVDEYGRSETQRSAPGASVAAPLRLFQYAVGWTRKYIEQASVRDAALRVSAAKKAHLKRLRYDIKRAIYLSANYTYNDHLVDRVDLAVKRLVNADSAAIPDGPDGATFTVSSHTHYDATASLTATNLGDAINDLTEHGHGARVMVAVHSSDAAAVVALTGFVAAVPVYVETPAYNVTVPSARTTPTNQFNRLLGYFNGAEVWVKPWAVDNYLFLWDAGDTGKPLLFRQRNVAAALQGLRLAAELDGYPLHAQFFEAEFGLGVWTRTNGVVLYTGGGSYADPTLTQ